jgi:hypothetical protein
MKIHEWEIWHSYSTYFSLKKSLNLEKVATNMISSGFAECVIQQDGNTFLRTNQGYQKGKTIVDFNDVKFKSTFDTEDTEETIPTDFAKEAWGIASKFRLYEKILFRDHILLPPPNFRAYLGLTRFCSEENTVQTYPVVTLYETGVLLLELRIIHPNKSVELSDFIEYNVNMHNVNFDFIQCPPAISKSAPLAYECYTNYPSSLAKRKKIIRQQLQHNNEIDKLTINEKVGDFRFNLSPLHRLPGQIENLSSYFETIRSIVGYLIGKTNSKIDQILPRINFLPETGDYWIARRQIHIIKHEFQQETSKLNEIKNKRSFGSILAGTTGKLDEAMDTFVPKDVRPFDDYSGYITSSKTLWIWSSKGKSNKENPGDPNRDSLIYENQIKNELLEYGFMVYKSFSRFLDFINNTSNVIKSRKIIQDFDNRLENISHSGEINDLIIFGWRAYGLGKIKKRIKEKISIIEMEAKYIESRRIIKISWALSVLFGFSAIPTFALLVIKPLWDFLNFPCPVNENTSNLLFVLISFVLMLIVITIIFKKNKHSNLE